MFIERKKSRKKIWKGRSNGICAGQNTDFSMEKGEIVVILGPAEAEKVHC